MILKDAIRELIAKVKKEKRGKAVGSVSRDLSKGRLSVEALPLDVAAPLAEDPISTTGSLAHRDKRAMLQIGGDLIEAEQIPIEIAEEPVETQLPDEEMEGNYIDFVISEALVPEEEQYLLDRLNEDDQLSMIFDKVVETASEFSGSGSVEGPGSAVSDSIPARLSDGEFVMTSKATEQIGAETLQELMSAAEGEAEDDRQTIAIGGVAKAEGSAILAGVSEDERGIAMKNKEAMRLLDPRLSLFAS
jgi:hypothetical protein